MKLPISFGSRLFNRVLAPGLIVAGTIWLLRPPVVAVAGMTLDAAILFPATALIAGWVFLLCDRPIYMLFEGRRFWPRRLRRHMIRRERGRLARILRRMRTEGRAARKASDAATREDARRAQLEAASLLHAFPLTPRTWMRTVAFPTRLGNLIQAYELYPLHKHGMDSIFFWPRIWVSLDKSLRDEIDSQQSQADGALYAALALILSALVFGAAALGAMAAATGEVAALIFAGAWSGMSEYAAGLLHIAGAGGRDTVLAIGAAALARWLYLVSLHTHEQFGETFTAIFDQHRDAVKIDETVAMIADALNDPGLQSAPPHARRQTAWRFLRWHRVRPTGAARNRRADFP